jgi:hypothetical protein
MTQRKADDGSCPDLSYQPCTRIFNIPMTIYADYVEYGNNLLKIKCVNMETPFKITIKTKPTNFGFAAMSKNYMSVTLDHSDVEPEFPKGYSIMVNKPLESILELL